MSRRSVPLSVVVGLCAVALVPGVADAAPSQQGRIAWSRFVNKQFDGAHIVTARADGSDVRELTKPPRGVYDIYPKWSPDLRRILFERDLANGHARIVVIDATGRHQRVIDTGCTDPCADDLEPTWTPDGRIAFTRVVGPFDQVNDSATSAVLFTADLSGRNVRRLSQAGIDGAYEDYGAKWAPDGSYVEFVRIRNDRILSAVFRMAPDATDVRQLTPWDIDADIADLSPATSGATKDLVVFETRAHDEQGAVQNIQTVPATCPDPATCTAAIRDVTTNPADGSTFSVSPAWSPDGHRIAFAQWTLPDTDAGIAAQHWFSDVFTADPDGSDRRQVSRTELWDWRPAWGGVGG